MTAAGPERERDELAALGLRSRLTELVDALHDAIDEGCDRRTLHAVVASWEAEVGPLTFDELVDEGSPTPCDDCGTDVAPLADDGRPVEGGWEWFMVHDDVWQTACLRRGDARHLCIGCLETRLGRTLTREDFTDVPANTAATGLETERLRLRLATQAAEPDYQR